MRVRHATLRNSTPLDTLTPVTGVPTVRVEGGVVDPDLQLKRWTRKEYEHLVDRGIFTHADRIELIDGLLIVSEPQSAYHYTAVGLVVRALGRAFGDGWTIRSQGPLALDDR